MAHAQALSAAFPSCQLSRFKGGYWTAAFACEDWRWALMSSRAPSREDARLPSPPG